MLIFFDTETTGVSREDRLAQLAYKSDEGGFEDCKLFKPPVPMNIEATVVNHITNKMVAEKEEFKDSSIAAQLQEFIAGGHYFVAHNARFDVSMLAKEGIIIPPAQTICTLKLIKHLDAGRYLKHHSLQFIRYFYELEVDAVAHHAMGDVMVLEAVYNHLLTLCGDEISPEELAKI